MKFFWPYRLVWPKPLCFALDNKGLRSSPPEVSCKKGVHKNIAKFTGKHLSQSLFLIEVQIKINLITPTSGNGCFCSKLPLHPLLLKRNIIRKLRSIFFTPLCIVSQNFKKACPMFPFIALKTSEDLWFLKLSGEIKSEHWRDFHKHFLCH